MNYEADSHLENDQIEVHERAQDSDRHMITSQGLINGANIGS